MMFYLPSRHTRDSRPFRRWGVRRIRPRLEQLEDRLAMSAVWTPQGPGPILWGQPQGMDPQSNPQVGSVSALAPDPNNPNLLYAGTCSGGIWKTTNATAIVPTWVPLTDNQPTLSIASLALSPLDSNVVYAGTGNYSSGGLPDSSFYPGGLPEGVLKSSDGGQTWSLYGQSTFQGQNIRAIAPSSVITPQGQLVLASSYVLTQNFPPPNMLQTGGVYESNDGGVTWERLSGASGSGLPNPEGSSAIFEPFDTSLIADPTNPGVFYATIFGSAVANGVYRGVYNSATNSVHWELDNGSGDFALPSDLLQDADNLQLAVSSKGPSGTLYLLTNTFSNSTTNYLYYSTDGGGTWKEMDTVPDISNEGRGAFLLVAATDPTSRYVVYVSGSDQSNDLPGIVYRGDWNKPSGQQWTLVAGPGATGTPPGGSGNNPTDPHSDSKALAFDAQGNLLLGDDGGIYKLVNPNGARPTDRYWVSVNGTLQDTELYTVAYDAIDHTIIGGAQDDGMAIQPKPGAAAWNQGFFDDVTHVAVDDSRANAIVYGMGIFFDLYYGDFSTQANTLTQAQLADQPDDLRYSGLSSADQLLANGSTFGYIPFALDSVASPKKPYRSLLLGYNNLYESSDQGNTITELTLPYQNGVVSAIAAGGYSGGVGNPDVAYVGTNSGQIYVRTAGSGAFTLVHTFAGAILRIVLDPNEWHTAYAVVNDSSLNSTIWQTTDAGQTWTNVTGNLHQLALEVDTVKVVHPTPQTTVLVAGALGTGLGAAQGSVFATMGPINGAATSWRLVGAGLPDVMVSQVVYDPADDVLIAGTYGRGAWTLDHAAQVLLPPSPPPPPIPPVPPTPLPPEPPTPPATLLASVQQQLLLNMQLLPNFSNAQAQAALAQMFGVAFMLAQQQGPAQAQQLVLQEAMLFLALASNDIAAAIAASSALADNPLYNTTLGYSLGLAEGEWILSGMVMNG
jgi:photosystem II stability/assembly factor-like uncharacterized protein